MKKIIILCTLTCSLVSTTTFGMLVRQTYAKQLIQKNNLKRSRYDSILPPEFPQTKRLLETLEENKGLKEEIKNLKDENAFLQHKLECYSCVAITLALTEERMAMPGKAKDRDFGHGNMNQE